MNHRGILKLKSRAALVAGVMTRGRAGVVRKRIRFLFCFRVGNKKYDGAEWGKSVASYIDTQQLHENEKVLQHNATSV